MTDYEQSFRRARVGAAILMHSPQVGPIGAFTNGYLAACAIAGIISEGEGDAWIRHDTPIAMPGEGKPDSQGQGNKQTEVPCE